MGVSHRRSLQWPVLNDLDPHACHTVTCCWPFCVSIPGQQDPCQRNMMTGPELMWGVVDGSSCRTCVGQENRCDLGGECCGNSAEIEAGSLTWLKILSPPSRQLRLGRCPWSNRGMTLCVGSHMSWQNFHTQHLRTGDRCLCDIHLGCCIRQNVAGFCQLL